MFYAVELFPGVKPEDLITMMEGKQQDLEMLGMQIDDASFMHHLLNLMGRSYCNLESQLAQMINSPVEPLTVKKIREEIKAYDIQKGREIKKPFFAKKLPENALVAFKKPFKGVCK